MDGMVQKIQRYDKVVGLLVLLLSFLSGCSDPSGGSASSLSVVPPDKVAPYLLRCELLQNPDLLFASLLREKVSEPVAAYWTGMTALSVGNAAVARKYLTRANSKSLPACYSLPRRIALADTLFADGKRREAQDAYLSLVGEVGRPRIRFLLSARLCSCAWILGNNRMAIDWFAVLREESPCLSGMFSYPAEVAETLIADLNGESVNYALQVGIYSSPRGAEEAAHNVRRAGCSVEIIPSQGKWRVLAGPFKTRSEATQAAIRLKKAGIPSFLKVRSNK